MGSLIKDYQAEFMLPTKNSTFDSGIIWHLMVRDFQLTDGTFKPIKLIYFNRLNLARKFDL